MTISQDTHASQSSPFTKKGKQQQASPLVNVNPSLFPEMIQNSAKLKQIWMNGNRNSKKRSSNTFVNTSMTSAELLERVQEAYPHTLASNEELAPNNTQETRQSQARLKQQLNQNQYFPS
jgi:hypothetical protein